MSKSLLNAIEVLGTLVESKDLLEVLRKIDSSTGAVSAKMDVERVLTTDMDWEEDAPSSESNLNHSLSSLPFQERKPRLFALGECGAFHTFQMLILQCEAEIQFVSPESQRSVLKSLEYAKYAGFEIFNSRSLSNSAMNTQPETYSMPLVQDEGRALGRHTCFDVKYRGDWMRRPIESTEVAWLVRLLVRLSDIINDRLNLAGEVGLAAVRTSCHKLSDNSKGSPKLKFEELNVAELLRASKHSVVNLSFFDLAKEMRAFLLSCWGALCDQLQRHGWRVNLRFLGQKPVVVLMLVFFSWMLKKLSFLYI
ncbi:hypothetical protein L7F22_063553 [Adiantum nelumboides]|nr:hypothetical protein [Adiantum nelumboides]